MDCRAFRYFNQPIWLSKKKARANLVVGAVASLPHPGALCPGGATFGRAHWPSRQWLALQPDDGGAVPIAAEVFRPSQGQGRFFIALATSLLFAVHPILIPKWWPISRGGRDRACWAAHWLFTYSFRAYMENKPVLNIVVGLVFFLGLMSKENSITFLAVVPMAFYFFAKASPG